jgi:hypothetical protein
MSSTVDDVARQAGISKNTVSLARNDKVGISIAESMPNSCRTPYGFSTVQKETIPC